MGSHTLDIGMTTNQQKMPLLSTGAVWPSGKRVPTAERLSDEQLKERQKTSKSSSVTCSTTTGSTWTTMYTTTSGSAGCVGAGGGGGSGPPGVMFPGDISRSSPAGNPFNDQY